MLGNLSSLVADERLVGGAYEGSVIQQFVLMKGLKQESNSVFILVKNI